MKLRETAILTWAFRELEPWPARRTPMAKGNDGTNLRFRVGRWVAWSGNVSPERGVAGGSVRITSPFRSHLLSAILFLALAIVVLAFPVTALGTAAIFGAFAVWHAIKWWLGLPTPLEVVQQVEENVDRQVRAVRAGAAAYRREAQSAGESDR